MHRANSSAFAPSFVIVIVVVVSILAACAASDESSRASAATPRATTTGDAGHDASAAAPAPIVTTATLEEQGETLVRERGCARCHQSPNANDGVLSGQTTPRPGTRVYGSNLTPDLETGIGGWSDRMIAQAIGEGIDEEGDPLCTTMPRFADLTDDETDAIIAYLRALDPVHRPVPRGECDGSGRDDAGASSDARSTDGGACGSWAPPDASAACHACVTPPCQPNGCFNGWWCDAVSRACRPAPDACAP